MIPINFKSLKKYHWFFLILKVALVTQFVLVFANKESIDSKWYIATEVIFKTSLALWIEWFVFHHIVDELDFEDKIILSFAGGLLFYDAWVNDFPRFLAAFNIKLPSIRI
jgi:lipoprotein signal peptidase